uniref:DRBM domain-containing protein n=1 Tax=Cyprinus carpio carpio TaxID=630221 RepID=A0A8C1EJ45_CYPCA
MCFSPQSEMKSSSSTQQAECNPVGALQELVVQKGWRLPEYTVTQESGPAHRKEFTMTCRVERFVEIGTNLYFFYSVVNVFNLPGCSTCQCCPQCPSVPQDHGRGEINHSKSSPVTFLFSFCYPEENRKIR